MLSAPLPRRRSKGEKGVAVSEEIFLNHVLVFSVPSIAFLTTRMPQTALLRTPKD